VVFGELRTPRWRPPKPEVLIYRFVDQNEIRIAKYHVFGVEHLFGATANKAEVRNPRWRLPKSEGYFEARLVPRDTHHWYFRIRNVMVVVLYCFQVEGLVQLLLRKPSAKTVQSGK